MTETESGGTKAPASVAIVAMGASVLQWMRRSYNGDNPKFFEHTLMQRFEQLFGPQYQDLVGKGLEDLIGKMTYAQRDEFISRLSEMGPTPAQQELLKSLAHDFGEKLVVNEIGEPFDEVWGINHIGKVLKVDKIFLMDDLRVEAARYANMLDRIDVPIFTSKAYPEYPTSVEFPINEAVAEIGGMVYFTNTIAYTLAYALMNGVKRIGMYGCDFMYDNSWRSEQARANVEFILGIAHERGVKIEICEGSTTMDNHKPGKLYGYAQQPTLMGEGQILKYSEQEKRWIARPIARSGEAVSGAEVAQGVPQPVQPQPPAQP